MILYEHYKKNVMKSLYMYMLINCYICACMYIHCADIAYRYECILKATEDCRKQKYSRTIMCVNREEHPAFVCSNMERTYSSNHIISKRLSYSYARGTGICSKRRENTYI